MDPDPGSGIRNRFFPGSGSGINIPDPQQYFEKSGKVRSQRRIKVPYILRKRKKLIQAAIILVTKRNSNKYFIFQVSGAFGIPQKNIYISLVLVAHFLGTSLPPTPSWSRFDLFIYLQYFILLYF